MGRQKGISHTSARTNNRHGLPKVGMHPLKRSASDFGSTTNLVGKYFYSGFELIVKVTLVEMMNKEYLNLIALFGKERNSKVC
jgi:hypothetical protein